MRLNKTTEEENGYNCQLKFTLTTVHPQDIPLVATKTGKVTTIIYFMSTRRTEITSIQKAPMAMHLLLPLLLTRNLCWSGVNLDLGGIV
jgi:hypothetical protein